MGYDVSRNRGLRDFICLNIAFSHERLHAGSALSRLPNGYAADPGDVRSMCGHNCPRGVGRNLAHAISSS